MVAGPGDPLNQEATGGTGLIRKRPGRAPQKRGDAVAGVQDGERLPDEAGPGLRVTIQRLAEQGFLIAEGGIKARRVDAHGGGEVANARALVALAPEHLSEPTRRTPISYAVF